MYISRNSGNNDKTFVPVFKLETINMMKLKSLTMTSMSKKI